VAAEEGAALAAELDEADAPTAARQLLMDKLSRATWPRSVIAREAAAAGIAAELIDVAAVQLGVKTVERTLAITAVRAVPATPNRAGHRHRGVHRPHRRSAAQRRKA